MTEIISNLEKIYNTLSLISVKGEDDTQRMGGCLEMIRIIAVELKGKEEVSTDA